MPHLPRFFVPGLAPDLDVNQAPEVVLPAKAAHHARKVLRLQANDSVQLFDGAGRAWNGQLAAHPQHTAVRLTDLATVEAIAHPRLALVQGLSTAEKMDWTIEKAVELGVDYLVPVSATHSKVRLDEARALKKHERWSDMIISACAQSGRNTLPVLAPVQTLSQWLTAKDAWGAQSVTPVLLAPTGLQALTDWLFAWRNDKAHRPGAPAQQQTLALLVGPESGFADAETTAIMHQATHAVQCRMGPSTLRTETAGLAALALTNGILNWRDEN